MTNEQWIDIINPLQTSWATWGVTILCAMIIGISKSGLKGFGMITIPILANLYGGMLSTAIILPFLVFGDTYALYFYRASAEWKYIKKVYPWALVGIAVALVIGKFISDSQFRYAIAISVLICLIILVYKELKGGKMDFVKRDWFSTTLGLSGGFATMIGNAAGPIFNLYLLSMRLPKNTFIATGAWFFLTLNLIKIPLHLWVWDSMNMKTLQLNFVLLPTLLAGATFGKYLVKKIPERPYRIFVIVTMGVTSILLFFK
ncbi:sulfite exporter TauE/SafE family protein [bacterium]|nr:sulfite exporter TauE/SafE family protein [bacterium]